MKKTVKILLATVVILVKTADISPEISHKLLNKSKTIADMKLEDNASYQEISHELFKDLTPQQAIILQQALENDNPDLADPEKPSAQTIAFVNNLDINDAPWLIEKADFWNIQYVYEALFNRITALVKQGSIDIANVNKEIEFDILRKTVSDIKTAAKNILQKEIFIAGKETSSFVFEGTFNANGSKIFFFSPYIANIPIYVYNVSQNNISTVLPNPLIDNDEKIISVKAHNNDTQIIITTKKTQSAESKTKLYVLDVSSGQVLLQIPLTYTQVYPLYSSHGSKLLIPKEIGALLYDTGNKSTPLLATIPYKGASNVMLSPGGSEIAMLTLDGLFFYNANNQNLIRSLPGPSHNFLNPVYNSDDTQLLIRNVEEETSKEIITLLNLHNNNAQQLFSGPKGIQWVAFSPDNKNITIIANNQLLIYNNSGMLIRNVPLPLKSSTDISADNYVSAKYKANSSQIIIQKPTKFILYDIPTNSLNEFPKHTPDGSLFLIDEKGIYNSKALEFEEIKIDGTYIFNARYSPDGRSLLLNTARYSPDKATILANDDHSFILYPILSHIDFNAFTQDQLLLLFKASQQWKKMEPYTIKTPIDLQTYESLDPIFKSNRLFKATYQQIIQDARASADFPQSSRVKDFFAGLTHTVYRWLGRYDKPWPQEEGSKEAEKEEE